MGENPQNALPLGGNPNPRSSEDRGPDQGKQEGRFSGISRQRWIELMRHYAEIQQYQRQHGLEDKGDPPPEDPAGSSPCQ